MQNTGVNGRGGVLVKSEDVISKLKDDGDFDRLRLKIIRKLKENEELRSNIISMVKQSSALNRPGVENMKPRQLSDVIHQEIGDKVMSQISDGVWDVIRSADGMKNEITGTVQSVYDKLSNPCREDENQSSCQKDSQSTRNEFANNGVAMGTNGALAVGESPNGPPRFDSIDVNQRRKSRRTKRPSNNNGLRAMGKNKHSEDLPEPDDMDCEAPPGFPCILKPKNSGDDSDEDPDVPPGFGSTQNPARKL